jgi:L-lactate dehydrogenase complex protein LldG
MDEILELFISRAREQQSEVHIIDSTKDAVATLSTVIKDGNIKSVAIQGTLAQNPSAWLAETVSDLEVSATADIAVSEACCAIADTGSVVVYGPRSLFALAEIHLVIINPEDIKGSMEELFEVAPATEAMTILSGPSRTADVERVLVTGAHGARRMIIFVMGGIA